MRALSASALLSAWEQALPQAPFQRALTLLSAADPETPLETFARLTIGERDARLLTLREQTFGSRLACLVACPGCGERMELTFAVEQIRINPPSEAMERLTLAGGGYSLEFRLPQSIDLAVAARTASTEAGRLELIRQCLLNARKGDQHVAAETLPPEVIDAIGSRMAECDPQAHIELAVSCTQCGREWLSTFSILSFLWSEVNVWARRMMREIHMLASAYGWSEADILAMSPWKRRVYLEMVGE